MSERSRQSRKADEIRIQPHSMILYWWAVWLAAWFCAFVTYVWGEKRDLGSGKEVLIHSDPLVGIFFLSVVLFVILFTTVRMKTLPLLVILALLLPVAVGFHTALVYFSGGTITSAVVLDWLGLLLVHMNLAFYVTLGTALLFLWTLILLGVDRLIYWHVSPGWLTKKERFQEDEIYHAPVQIQAENRDVVRHWILGLGSGNIVITRTVGPGERPLPGRRIENVWKARKKAEQAHDLVNKVVTTDTQLGSRH